MEVNGCKHHLVTRLTAIDDDLDLFVREVALLEETTLCLAGRGRHQKKGSDANHD